MKVVRSLLVSAALLGAVSEAWALDCALPHDAYAQGSAILFTCLGCPLDQAPAELIASNGSGVPLTEVARVALAEGGFSAMYNAATPLEPGLEYGLQSGPFTTQVEMEAAELPQLPTVELIGYQMGDSGWGPVREALFKISGAHGVLVADEGEQDDDPMQNSRGATVGRTEFTFSLGQGLCVTTLKAADFGLETRVRFGVLSPSGEFSGWTEWFELSYPETEGKFGPTAQTPDPEPEPVGANNPPDGPELPVMEGTPEAKPPTALAPGSGDPTAGSGTEESSAPQGMGIDSASGNGCAVASPKSWSLGSLVALLFLGLAFARRKTVQSPERSAHR